MDFIQIYISQGSVKQQRI